MKTQMQIVEDAIEKLEKLSREDFIDTLIAAGAEIEEDEADHDNH